MSVARMATGYGRWAAAIALWVGGAFLVWYVISQDESHRRPWLDAEQPLTIELGRGSGREGLETGRVTQDGAVTLHRMNWRTADGVRRLSWEKASLRLAGWSLRQVVDAALSNGL